ncbi:MAG: hypothetical protein Kow0092_23050 [Deferrisomatales bacterium]
MARYSFGKKGGRVTRRRADAARSAPVKSPEEVLRELREGRRPAAGEDYRERSLAIHGLVCARYGREFDRRNRHLLTVHHKDGDHHNNPPDGSNWENLCVYCHDDAHSRAELGNYVAGGSGEASTLVHRDSREAEGGDASLGALLRKALEKKGSSGS